MHEFETKLEFKPEVKEFLRSERQCDEFGGRPYLKAGDAGMPHLAGKAAMLLTREDRTGIPDWKFPDWKCAAVYDAATHEPVMANYDGYCLLTGDPTSMSMIEKMNAHDNELHKLVAKARNEARERAWEELSARWSEGGPEEARGRYFGNREQWRLADRNDVARHYVAHRTLEVDWAARLDPRDCDAYDRLRAAFDREALVAELAGELVAGDHDRLHIMHDEWLEVVAQEGEAIAREQAGMADLVDAVRRSDAKTVKAVYLEDGHEAEYAIGANLLVAQVENLGWPGQWHYTPSLDHEPDRQSLLGVKYRGKWIWRPEAA